MLIQETGQHVEEGSMYELEKSGMSPHRNRMKLGAWEWKDIIDTNEDATRLNPVSKSGYKLWVLSNMLNGG